MTISPKPMAYRRRSNETSYMSQLLTISPAEELEFCGTGNGREICDTIYLTNNLSNGIAYKIQTTYPDRYKIHPRSGIVKAGTTTEVFVFLQNGYPISSIQRDKLRVMWTEVPDNTDNVRELWKTVSKDNVNEHRLRCSITSSNSPTKDVTGVAAMSTQLERLICSTSYLKSSVWWMTLSLGVLIVSVTVVVSIVYYFLQGMIDTCYSPVF